MIKTCYEKYKNPYVSYSGGKDSLVLTHMVLQQQSRANVWHWDYGDELMPRSYEQEVVSNLKKIGAKNIIINKRKGSGRNTTSGYKQFFGQIKKNKELYGWDIGIIGVRQLESKSRKQSYNKYFKKDCYPLRKLTVNDIWAYIITNNIPYPHHYDLRGDYEGWDQIRFVTFFDPEFSQLNSSDNIFIFEKREDMTEKYHKL